MLPPLFCPSRDLRAITVAVASCTCRGGGSVPPAGDHGEPGKRGSPSRPAITSSSVRKGALSSLSTALESARPQVHQASCPNGDGRSDFIGVEEALRLHR